MVFCLFNNNPLFNINLHPYSVCNINQVQSKHRIYLFRIRSEAMLAVSDPATDIPTNIVITPTYRPAVVIGYTSP